MSEGFDRLPVPVKLLTAGSAACFADFVSFPLDTAKVRLQVQGQAGSSIRRTRIHTGELMVYSDPGHYRGILGTIHTIAKEEGFRSLYNGLNAGLQRQFLFASVRLGMYEPVKTKYQKILGVGENTKSVGLLDISARIMAGLTTGAMAVMVAQPTDVVKIKFQAAAKPDPQLNPNARLSTFGTYKAIFTSEGMAGLWRGALPNMGRNAIVNVAEIVCYDVVKEKIIKSGWLEDNVPCHFTSAVISGFCATLCASPVDVIKTRYMNSSPGTYRGAFDCGVQTLKKEGPSAFYKGFWPSFSRLVSWNIIMWISYEQLKRVVAKNYNKVDKE